MAGKKTIVKIVLFLAVCICPFAFVPGPFIGIAAAEVSVTVSILPQKYIVERIGGDQVTVNVMVTPGANPATYEPRPQQMVSLAHSDIYFAVGVPFESVWLDRFVAMHPRMKVVDTSDGLKLHEMEAHPHDHQQAQQPEHGVRRSRQLGTRTFG
jgi:zinc transport system substrate-binding protein